VRLRESVRALIVDPDGHVLLVRFDWEGVEPAGGFWANPGGGIEPGESRLAAIQRELREEIGMVVDSLGPELWTKTARFPIGSWDGQVDHIHLYRSERFEPSPQMSTAQLTAENIHDIRWWAPQELTSSNATFAPRSLPQLLHRLRREGVPAIPIQLDGF
jgi:8-oxo-dGTP pyrophosphatase MutT (NUDIX family)